MNIVFHSIYKNINAKNALFSSRNVDIGDDLLMPFNFLGNEIKRLNMKVGTSDSELLKHADIIFFIDHPGNKDEVYKYAISNDIKMYLISLESPIISKQIFDKSYHEHFAKVFTWSDFLVENNPQKYVKINYSYEISYDFDVERKRNKQTVIIAGNKVSGKKKELYSQRLKCIKWFNRNHPEALDLFGFGWDSKMFNGDYLIGRIANGFLRRFPILKQDLKVYKGPVKRKNSVLREYNFSICFENVYGHSGYITEKIFDCFFAGTIPIYKGAPNIFDYIPQNCIINYDDFKSVDFLYEFMSTMPEANIIQYRKNIKDFLGSNKVESFSISTFANTILETIKNI